MSILFPVITAEQFSESYKYIPILITAAVFNSIVAMFSVVYIAKKLTRKVLATSLLAALINIIINLALIKYIGIYSAAISTFCAFLAMALFRGYDIQKYVSIKYNTSVIVWLSLLYALVITLYYINTDLLNIISTIIVLVSAFVLNRTLIQAIIRKSKYSLRLKFKSQFAQ
jgi:O-antigen/teichoic acid export membrane protein